LEGRDITADVIAEAREAASLEVHPISDVRSSAAYRRHLSGVLVQRAVSELSGVEVQR